jgi:hypothetical protein
MKLEKILKILDEDTVNELNSADTEELKRRLIQSEQSIKQAREEMEANPLYQKLKEDMSVFRQGFNEVKKRQNCIIQYSLIRLEETGAVVTEEASEQA